MIKERKDIPAKYKWDLTAIYPTEADFLAEYDAVESRIRGFAAYEERMLTGARALYETLSERTAIRDLMGKLWQYASLSFLVDMSDTAAQAREARVRRLYVLFGEVAWFITPRMLTLDEGKAEAWFEEYPALAVFRRTVEDYLRFRPHALSEEGEKVLSEMGDALGTHSGIYDLLTDSDMRFGRIRGEDGKLTELSDTNYAIFMRSADRRVRRAAFHRLYACYEQYASTVAALYEGRIKEACTRARLRKYPDSITASTDGDEVTPEIYNNLIDTVHRSLPALYGYYELKREVLGLPKLHLYDVYTPLVGSYERSYTYEEAVDEVLRTVRVLGEDYTATLREGLTERGWVDVYPSRGKRGGAFSSSNAMTEPYILMNFNGKMGDVSTLAHEAGHSMHSLLSAKSNPSHLSHPTIFVAEVASTVNELLLAHRRLAESGSDGEKLAILNDLMETYKGSLFRQTMFAEFERDMHAMYERGEPLTKDSIAGRYYELNRLYFGDGVVCDGDIAYEWTRIPHFYSCFYVYKYATCVSAATAIVKRIESEGEAYVRKYLAFLSAGDSVSPLDSLLLADVDMASPAVIEAAAEEFASLVTEFRRIYQKSKQ